MENKAENIGAKDASGTFKVLDKVEEDNNESINQTAVDTEPVDKPPVEAVVVDAKNPGMYFESSRTTDNKEFFDALPVDAPPVEAEDVDVKTPADKVVSIDAPAMDAPPVDAPPVEAEDADAKTPADKVVSIDAPSVDAPPVEAEDVDAKTPADKVVSVDAPPVEAEDADAKTLGTCTSVQSRRTADKGVSIDAPAVDASAVAAPPVEAEDGDTRTPANMLVSVDAPPVDTPPVDKPPVETEIVDAKISARNEAFVDAPRVDAPTVEAEVAAAKTQDMYFCSVKRRTANKVVSVDAPPVEAQLVDEPVDKKFMNIEAKVVYAQTQRTSAQSRRPDVSKIYDTSTETKCRFMTLRGQYDELMERLASYRQERVRQLLKARINEQLAAITNRLMSAFSEDKEAQIQEALKPDPPNEVVARIGRYTITRLQLKCLPDNNWLNDAVINFYMTLISTRCREEKYFKYRPKVYTFDSFFCPKLESSGPRSLSKWTKNVDIFDFELILIPVHVVRHWCMLCINTKQKTIMYYDSLMLPEVIRTLTRKYDIEGYLIHEYKLKKNAYLDLSEWTTGFANTPQQENLSDCGVFACQYAEFLSRNARLTFNQNEMPFYRKRMLLEILDGRLLL